MRTEYIFKEELKHVLATLMPANRLVLEICLATGLRLSDVLNFKTDSIKTRFTVREIKTGKNRRIFLNNELLDRCKLFAGKIFVFENRVNYRNHRTRQAVWQDIKRSSKLLRIKNNIAPHSTRKVYAVEQYHKDNDLERVKKLLNHSDSAVTAIYAFADVLVSHRLGEKEARKGGGK